MDRPVLSRLRTLRGVVVGLFVITAVSQARVQLIQRGAIVDRAVETHRFTQSHKEEAKRGSIWTADGKPLAVDDAHFRLGVTASTVPKSDGFFTDLAAASGVPASEFAQLVIDGKGTKWWNDTLGAEQARAVQAVKTRWRADGISLTPSGARAYPLAEAASGIVGRTLDGRAESGLELAFDQQLSGVDGKTVGLVDRTGAFLPMRLDAETVARRDGESVVTTLESSLQQVATAALKQAVDSNKADRGVALVMTVDDFKIRAMANWPSYDPNQAPGATLKTKSSDYNTNYMGRLEPGSTFKVLTLALAMDRGLVQPNESIYCKGSLQVWGKQTVSCDLHHGTRAHGSVTPEVAIAKSCNVAAATWAARLGRDAFIGSLERMHLLEKPGLGMPGEVPGSINRNDYATGLQLATFGFGQSMTLTPVGLLSAFAMLGNDGVQLRPSLVERVGKQTPERPVGERVLRSETAHRMLGFMEAVIDSDAGTGKSLRIPGYRLGGKTGTAEKMGGGRGYVSSFVGFVPAENPKVAILVMVDNPQAGRYYGASVAGPVFKELAGAVIRRYGLPPSAARPEPKVEIQVKPSASTGTRGQP